MAIVKASLLLVLLALVAHSSASNEQTHTICENSLGKLSCPVVYYRIKVKSAMYGRRDRNVCFTTPALKIANINCESPSADEVVKKACDGANECLLDARNSLFGNPCADTYKYLKVVYECHDPYKVPTKEEICAKHTCDQQGSVCDVDAANKKPVCLCESSCIEIMQPVCAMDGNKPRTFTNKCKMDKEACEKGTSYKMLYEGSCKQPTPNEDKIEGLHKMFPCSSSDALKNKIMTCPLPGQKMRLDKLSVKLNIGSTVHEVAGTAAQLNKLKVLCNWINTCEILDGDSIFGINCNVNPTIEISFACQTYTAQEEKDLRIRQDAKSPWVAGEAINLIFENTHSKPVSVIFKDQYGYESNVVQQINPGQKSSYSTYSNYKYIVEDGTKKYLYFSNGKEEGVVFDGKKFGVSKLKPGFVLINSSLQR